MAGPTRLELATSGLTVLEVTCYSLLHRVLEPTFDKGFSPFPLHCIAPHNTMSQSVSKG